MSDKDQICPDKISEIARLAKIAVDPEQCQHYSDAMVKVMGLFEQLADVDDSDFSAAQPHAMTEGTMRDDVTSATDYSDKIAQFSEYYDPTTGYIKVPTVIEGE